MIVANSTTNNDIELQYRRQQPTLRRNNHTSVAVRVYTVPAHSSTDFHLTIATEMEQTKPSRRWFRFRLRSLLIMVTLISVSLGWVDWVCWELDQRQREKSAIAWVYQMGGGINLHSRNDQRSWWEKTKGGWLGERVQVVRIGKTQVIDLSPLAALKKLQHLDLNNTKLTDLSPLTELKNLSELVLVDSHLSDEQVQKLRQALPNCNIEF